MIGFLTPFFIAFGIGAGIAILLTVMVGGIAAVWSIILLARDVVKEVVTWPRTVWAAARQGIADGLEDDRRRHARKARR